MAIDYKLESYRDWLEQNVILSDPFSSKALRNIAYHILMGRNYRLLTEPNTKGKMFSTFLWLSHIQKSAIEQYGEEWIEKTMNELLTHKKNTQELKNLTWWLMGLTSKTAANLGLKKSDYPDILKDTIIYFDELLTKIGHKEFKNTAWLLLMAGSATLNIRGSQKSKAGKQIERVILKVILNILGFKQNKTFWMNIDRDLEVEREADAEVQSKRGRIRIEVGLIAAGNQEVIEDKIARVGRNGIIIFDKLGAKTRVYETAKRAGVKLVQIRNNDPLLDIYRHLKPLVSIELNEVPKGAGKLKSVVNQLPHDIFVI